jgi:CdiI immunity protein
MPMTHTVIDRERFPRLVEFAEGYLHQDMLPQHGTAEGALQAYLEDANPREIAELKSEWQRLRGQSAKRSSESSSLLFFQDAFRILGAAWTPQTRAELDGISRLLTA